MGESRCKGCFDDVETRDSIDSLFAGFDFFRSVLISSSSSSFDLSSIDFVSGSSSSFSLDGLEAGVTFRVVSGLNGLFDVY